MTHGHHKWYPYIGHDFISVFHIKCIICRIYQDDYSNMVVENWTFCLPLRYLVPLLGQSHWNFATFFLYEN